MAKQPFAIKRETYSRSGCLHCKKIRRKCDEGKPSCKTCLSSKEPCVYNPLWIVWQPRKMSKHTTTLNSLSPLSVHNSPEATTSDNNTSTHWLHTGSNYSTATIDTSRRPSLSDQSISSMSSYSPLSSTKSLRSNRSSNSSTHKWEINSLSSPEANSVFPSVEKVEVKADISYEVQREPSNCQSLVQVKNEFDTDDNAMPEQFIKYTPVTVSENLIDLALSSANRVLCEKTLDHFACSPHGNIPDDIFLKMPKFTDVGYEEWNRIMLAYRPSSFVSESDLMRFLLIVYWRIKCSTHYLLGSDEANPLWSIIMDNVKKYEYLHYAMLVISAKLLMLRCRCNEWAPFADKYMNLCMDRLIANINCRDDPSQISALTMTVMLLLADKSASESNTWRIHLRGALQLLKAHPATTAATSDDKMHCILRTWFAHAETTAWLSAPHGGVDERLNTSLLDDSVSAMQVKGLITDGYNSFRGYGQELVPYFEMAAQASKMIYYRQEVLDMEFYLGAVEKVRQLTGVHYSLHGFSNPLVCAFMRMAHRVHGNALQLFIYVKLLRYPVTDPTVQQLTSRISNDAEAGSMMKELGTKVHWPLFMAGICAIDRRHMAVIENAFNLMISVGHMSSRNSLKRLQRCWSSEGSTENRLLAIEELDSIVL